MITSNELSKSVGPVIKQRTDTIELKQTPLKELSKLFGVPQKQIRERVHRLGGWINVMRTISFPERPDEENQIAAALYRSEEITIEEPRINNQGIIIGGNGKILHSIPAFMDINLTPGLDETNNSEYSL